MVFGQHLEHPVQGRFEIERAGKSLTDFKKRRRAARLAPLRRDYRRRASFHPDGLRRHNTLLLFIVCITLLSRGRQRADGIGVDAPVLTLR
jgi:hypothetical protein